MFELLTGLSGNGLRCGQVGTVVHVFTRPNQTYEVESVDKVGKPVASLPLLPGQVAPHSHAGPIRVAATEVACKQKPDDQPAVASVTRNGDHDVGRH